MNDLDKKKLIVQDEDYIESPRHSNSLKEFLAKNEDKEIDISTVSKILLHPEEEIKKVYQEALQKLKSFLS